MEQISIFTVCKKASKNKLVLSEYYDENKNKWISKNKLENDYVFRFKKRFGRIPGDVQRDIRNFYTEVQVYGLQQRGQNKTLEYKWSPVSVEEFNKINTIEVPRNIFKNDKEKNEFKKSKNNCCEICGSKYRLTIDHWRAYSIYKIDDKEIAALLCEKCNNIHHNYDPSRIITKYKDNFRRIWNWKQIEDRISKTFPPNEQDKKEQEKNIIFIKEYWNNNFNMNPDCI